MGASSLDSPCLPPPLSLRVLWLVQLQPTHSNVGVNRGLSVLRARLNAFFRRTLMPVGVEFLEISYANSLQRLLPLPQSLWRAGPRRVTGHRIGCSLDEYFPRGSLDEKVEKFASPAVAPFLLSTRPVYWEVCRENTNALGMGSCRTVCLMDTSSQYCNFTPFRVRKALCCLSPVGC